MTGTPPKVFISYSHDTVEHQERVADLADRLRVDGIDAEIDQYNTAPAEGWPLWCERQIAAAGIVLMVCTETYHRRVDGDEERGKGLGVVWEARIIRQFLYEAGAVSDKFVPVLFSDASPESIPTPIKAGTRYLIDTEGGYEGLYRRLTGQPRLLRPPLGTIRALPPKRRQWTEAPMPDKPTDHRSFPAFIMFLDATGFDRLNPRHVTNIQNTVFGRIATIISEINTNNVHDLNTCGSSVILVGSDPYQLSRCALKIRDYFRQSHWPDFGLPNTTNCCISLHMRNVSIGYDALRQRQGVLVSQVESIVHAGHIWATDSFQAQLSSSVDPRVCFDDLGTAELAEHWGCKTIYNVRWSDEPPIDYERIKANITPPHAEPPHTTPPPGTPSHGLPTATLMTFDDPANLSGYYDDFYNALNGLLVTSEQYAIVAGEGFDFANRKSRELAMTYTRVLANCAARHLVIRLEFTPQESPTEWIELLAKYAPFYDPERAAQSHQRPTGMIIYCPKRSTHLVRNMALVDPDFEQAGLLIMFPARLRMVGGDSVISRASTAIVTRHRPAVKHAYTSIQSLLEDTTLYRRISSARDLLRHYGLPDELLATEHDQATLLYFAFGSNMISAQIAVRAPSARRRGKAVLNGYKISFGLPPVPLAGAVATIVKSDDDSVEGIMYDINAFDFFKRLGFYEGVEDGYYKIENIDVSEEGRVVKNAKTYVFAEPYPGGRPSASYIDGMIDAGKTAGFSREYIMQLEDIKLGAPRAR